MRRYKSAETQRSGWDTQWDRVQNVLTVCLQRNRTDVHSVKYMTSNELMGNTGVSMLFFLQIVLMIHLVSFFKYIKYLHPSSRYNKWKLVDINSCDIPEITVMNYCRRLSVVIPSVMCCSLLVD